LFRSSSLRLVYVDYYFHVALGAVGAVYLVVTNCAIVSSTSLIVAACGLFCFLHDVSVKD